MNVTSLLGHVHDLTPPSEKPLPFDLLLLLRYNG
jgi:hypothetical protein